jgi:hypothetical protein
MEDAPPFDEAVSQLRAFLEGQGWPTEVVWRSRDDIARATNGDIYVRRRAKGRALELARKHYERGRRQGVGVALEVRCQIEGAACASVFWTADPVVAESFMMPDRGLKLSVATTRRGARVVGALMFWLALSRFE